ncbi:hypothetical protein N0V94_003264 [Neodidymelliopsis sp. IMI 364377]|nr:hypothetical protein N0V94_003264 [Neodidymelliopsis sp. IMI 364377]
MPEIITKAHTKSAEPSAKTCPKHKKTPSQIEDFLRRAGQANIKTKETGPEGEDWEVIVVDDDDNKKVVEENDWVFVE